MDEAEEMLRTSIIRFSGEGKRGSADRARAFVFTEWLLCKVHPCLVTPALLPAGRCAPVCKVLQSAGMLSFVRSGINTLRSLSHWLEALDIPTLALWYNIQLCVKLFRRSLPDVCCILDWNIYFIAFVFLKSLPSAIFVLGNYSMQYGHLGAISVIALCCPPNTHEYLKVQSSSIK